MSKGGSQGCNGFLPEKSHKLGGGGEGGAPKKSHTFGGPTGAQKNLFKRDSRAAQERPKSGSSEALLVSRVVWRAARAARRGQTETRGVAKVLEWKPSYSQDSPE